MAGGPLEVGKKTWQGLARRRRLLAENGIVLPDELPDVGQAAPDDVVDAAACAWSAFRFDSGFAVALPEDVETDLNGRRIAIWY
jgi:predicted RNase H-like nuclease